MDNDASIPRALPWAGRTVPLWGNMLNREKQRKKPAMLNLSSTVDLSIFWVFLGWIGCIVAGACAGSGKRATVTGAILGAILGPLGVIAALGLDGRYSCPRCSGKLDGEGNECQHCRLPLAWDERYGKPYRDKTRTPPDEDEHTS